MEKDIKIKSGIQFINTKILDTTNLVFVILGVPMLIASWLRINITGFNWVYVWHVVVVAAITVLYLLRKKIKTDYRIKAFIVILLLATLPSVPVFGFRGLWGYFIIFAAVLSSVFYGKKGGVIIAVYGLLYTSVFGFIRLMSSYNTSGHNTVFKSEDFYYLLFNGIALASLSVILAYTIDRFRSYFKTTLTDLAKVNKRKEESETKYKFLSDITFEGILVHNKGVIIDVNKALLELSGYSKEELIGKNIIELMAEEQYKDMIYSNIKNNCNKPYEIKVVRKDRTKAVFEVEGRSVEDKSGQEIRVSAVRDVSYRKQVEDEVKKLSVAVDQSSNTIVITDTDGNIVYVNPAFTKISGYSAEEAIGQNPRILNAGIQPRSYYAKMWDIITKGGTWKGEFCNKTKQGKLYWENVTITPIKNDAGEIVNYLAIKEDITERLKKEEELKEKYREIKLNNEYLEGLLKMSRYAINSTQDLFNTALSEAIRLTGSKIGFIMRYDEETQTLKLNSWSEKVLNACRVGGANTTFDLEKSGLWSDPVRQQKPLIINNYNDENVVKKGVPPGHIPIERYMGVPVFSDNKVVAIAAVANKPANYDDTDVRQITLLMDYVWKISDKIMLIDNLRKAKEKAEESDRLKSEFLASLSHEIRTPLNAIVGFSTILSEESNDPKHKYYSDIINKQNELLLQIINDVLEYSKIEAGVLDVQSKPVILNDIVENIYNVYKQKIPDNIDLIPVKLEDSCVVNSDENRLMQIFNNLVSNAIKFTKEGKISFGFRLNDSSEIVGFVEDTGIGIPYERQDMIFERFIKLNNFSQGIGLGLAIVKSVLELMKGQIWFESEPQKGSIFYFKLPFAVLDKGKPGKQTVRQNHLPENSFTEPTILIVEDEESNYLYLKELLSDFPFNIIHVDNGKDAVKVCEKKAGISMVLMDIKIPKLNGYEATRRIKRILPELPVIAQTAYASNTDKNKVFAAGCDDYISKPINRANLYKILEKYIGFNQQS